MGEILEYLQNEIVNAGIMNDELLIILIIIVVIDYGLKIVTFAAPPTIWYEKWFSFENLESQDHVFKVLAIIIIPFTWVLSFLGLCLMNAWGGIKNLKEKYDDLPPV